MGHPGFNRQWARMDEPPAPAPGRAAAAAARGATSADAAAPVARARRRGWPASSASAEHEQRRGPRARRGDVRSAILDVLRAAEETRCEQVNGYQVIQQIAERSGGAWRPSPGSVYPTIQQLEDEGLVETDDERGRRPSADRRGSPVRRRPRRRARAGVAPFDRRDATEETSFSPPQAGDRPGHGRGVADRHLRLGVSSSARRSTCSSRPGAGSTASSPTATTRMSDEEGEE